MAFQFIVAFIGSWGVKDLFKFGQVWGGKTFTETSERRHKMAGRHAENKRSEEELKNVQQGRFLTLKRCWLFAQLHQT